MGDFLASLYDGEAEVGRAETYGGARGVANRMALVAQKTAYIYRDARGTFTITTVSTAEAGWQLARAVQPGRRKRRRWLHNVGVAVPSLLIVASVVLDVAIMPPPEGGGAGMEPAAAPLRYTLTMLACALAAGAALCVAVVVCLLAREGDRTNAWGVGLLFGLTTAFAGVYPALTISPCRYMAQNAAWLAAEMPRYQALYEAARRLAGAPVPAAKPNGGANLVLLQPSKADLRMVDLAQAGLSFEYLARSPEAVKVLVFYQATAADTDKGTPAQVRLQAISVDSGRSVGERTLSGYIKSNWEYHGSYETRKATVANFSAWPVPTAEVDRAIAELSGN